jgi:hypothetical protein
MRVSQYIYIITHPTGVPDPTLARAIFTVPADFQVNTITFNF